MSLNDDEVQKQLDHMVKFIYREADEKASEIQGKAREECSIEKARIVMDEKMKIKKEFERKEKQIETKIKIAYSNELNLSRLTILKARDEGINKLKQEAHKKLAAISRDTTTYKKLLQDLIVQGLIKLEEPQATVVCRKQDLSLVQEVIKSAAAEYTQKSGKQLELGIETTRFLPPGPDETGSLDDSCSGGILLNSNQGRIICSNTLDDRLHMAFDQQLPVIREILYGKSLTRVHKD